MDRSTLTAAITPLEIPCDDLDRVLDFHDTTKLKRYRLRAMARRVTAYLTSARGRLETSRAYFRHPMLKQLKLPDADHLLDRLTLRQALMDRVSTRSFSSEKISCNELGAILSCFKPTRCTEIDGNKDLPLRFRAYPSGGGLYPVDILVAVISSEEISNGIYTYDLIEGHLGLMKSFSTERDINEFKSLFLDDQKHLDEISVVLMFVATFPRSVVKYGVRGYRLVLMEVGMMSFLSSLGASALGLASLHFAGFLENELDAFLGLDSGRGICHSVLIGRAKTADA